MSKRKNLNIDNQLRNQPRKNHETFIPQSEILMKVDFQIFQNLVYHFYLSNFLEIHSFSQYSC